MSSRLEITRPSTTRRLLATAALAAVLGLGVSMSAPAGSASAAPAASSSSSSSSSSSTAGADPIAASQEQIINREFHVTPRTVAKLVAGTLTPKALAGLICTQIHSGIQCAKRITHLLQGYTHSTDPRTCARGQGYIVSYPITLRSRCEG
ncbi:hypothetical protein [Clavibacter sp. VKM Ac-2872]|uniref:hypothetical protein n=1 Tax=Clavibacter sp. VKM Ac-2872 TaxID=2783812 RepID=UPI00188B6721|nr:hypothetical protein [Clavibacter sp. VKM Ac-2872]MBF4625250.1 hypothetical protein [Clavibacter sp. VKM Ac-2872]